MAQKCILFIYFYILNSIFSHYFINSANNSISSDFKNKTVIEVSPFQINCSHYNPGKETYHPINDAFWKHGERVPYLALAKTLKTIEEVNARLKMIEILANYFKSIIILSENDLLPSIYLCLNKLGPAYEGQELGIADIFIMKAVAKYTGLTLTQIKSDAVKTGDLGIVVKQRQFNQSLTLQSAPLTVQHVFNQLTEIAALSGKNSTTKKIDKIQMLFVACRDCEARYIIRSLAKKLRIGLAEESVLQALAVACVFVSTNQSNYSEILKENTSTKELKKKVSEATSVLKTIYCECPNYNIIIPVILKYGIKSLSEYCKITPGIPVKPMLAEPVNSLHTISQKFKHMKFTCEWKYDGERVQIHLLEDKTLKIFSRNLEDNTSKFPDIVTNFGKTLKSRVKTCIIDAEAVAWDRERSEIMPFQKLSTRRRKNATEMDIEVQVCVFLFDLLHLNGESLTQKPLVERRTMLKKHLQEIDGKFSFVKSIDTDSIEKVQEYLEESTKGNCEGLIIKTVDVKATYEIGKRSHNWLKLKKDYLKGVGDTLDLAVIGGYFGKGKRAGQYGGFLLASYDADNEEFQTICKIGTGFNNENLTIHYEFLKQHVIQKPKKCYRYDSSHEPDQWFDTVQVWEVKCADLSLSPIYFAGMGLLDPEKGISLRFPRFIRVRPDKSAKEATSSQQIVELYRNQDKMRVKP